MTIIDLNLLIYAVNRDAPNHSKARRWWEKRLMEDRPVGLAWIVVLGFLRVTTHPRIMPRPISSEMAVSIMDGWIRHPTIHLVEPTDRHWDILKEIVTPIGLAGNVTSDAHLAALAIEHGAELCSSDKDFARFSRLNWKDPLENE